MGKKKWVPQGARDYLKSLTPDTAVGQLNSLEYYDSHRALLELGKQVQDDNKYDGARVLACAAYGWMPTILKSTCFTKFNCTNPLETIRQISSIDDGIEFLNSMDESAPINNSWVGTSKFMHFLNSESFPIWDSKVAMNFGLSSHQQLNRKFSYLKYFDFVHEELAKDHRWIDSIAAVIEEKHHYTPSNVRCLEVMLFERMKK